MCVRVCACQFVRIIGIDRCTVQSRRGVRSRKTERGYLPVVSCSQTAFTRRANAVWLCKLISQVVPSTSTQLYTQLYPTLPNSTQLYSTLLNSTQLYRWYGYYIPRTRICISVYKQPPPPLTHTSIIYLAICGFILNPLRINGGDRSFVTESMTNNRALNLP